MISFYNYIGKLASMGLVCIMLYFGDLQHAIMFGVIALLFDSGVNKDELT